MIEKCRFLIPLFLFFISFGMSQENVTSVQLLSNNINKAHPFYKVLLKKDKLYINWIYHHCKGLGNKKTLKSPMNKPLVFSLQHEDTTVQDTIANCISPKLYENERELEWKSEIPLYGGFPEYIDFHLKNDPNIGAKIDLYNHREAKNIKMYVLTAAGDLLSTISDKPFNKGIHSLHWNTKDIKAGNYLLFTEVDTHLTIHQIRVEKNWWVNLFSRDKELSRRKSVIRKWYETEDLPELKGVFPYIQKNRFGTAIGLHLETAALVKIKLFAINGDFISTIYHKKLNAGETEFLLDTHIEKSGWYFIQLSIDDTRKYIRLKIKK